MQTYVDIHPREDVEAMCIDRSSIQEIPEDAIADVQQHYDRGVYIRTYKGVQLAFWGSYLLRGLNGVYYIMDDKRFHSKYKRKGS